MIELKHTDLFRHGRQIGYVIRDSVFLTREISQADQRKVRELVKEKHNDDVKRFIHTGRFVSH